VAVPEGSVDDWSPPVLQTVATTGEGVDQLIEALDAHFEHLDETGALGARRRARLEQHTRDVVNRAVSQWVWLERGAEDILAGGFERVARGEISPYKLAHDIISRLDEESTHAK
jgi:LAO/AO transport system kinase